MRIIRGVSIGVILLTAVVVAPMTVSAAETPTAPNVALAPAPNQGTYYQLPPSRILDTRFGNGAAQHPVGPFQTLTLAVSGRGGVPTTGVSAVVLNVTVANPTGTGYLTVYPTGVAMPTASSMNFVPGWVGANSVTVALGTGGNVNIFNPVGNVDIIADVVGFYALDDSMVVARGVGGQFQPVLPERIFDTREWGGQLPSGYYLQVPVSYGADADKHIRALVVNVTAHSAATAGYLTTFDGGSNDVPDTSTLNYLPGKIVPNMAIVPTAWCDECGGFPAIGVFTSANVDFLVDIVGFIDDGTLSDGLLFTPQTPVRIADTRDNNGPPLGPGATRKITAPASVAPDGTEALAMNVTAVAPTVITYLTVWPDGISGISQPNSSSLNPSAGQIVANSVYSLIGPAKAFNVFNSGGSVHVISDVVGTFALNPATQTKAASARFVGPRFSLTDNQPKAQLQKIG